MIKFPITIAKYVTAIFVQSVAAGILVLVFFTSLFDTLELVRESSSVGNITFVQIVEVEIFRIPYMFLEILPFGVFLGGQATFWRLSRSSEIVVVRAAGISIWQILIAPVSVSLAFGVLATMVISPIAAASFSRSEFLYNVNFKAQAGSLSLAGDNLWVRQVDSQLSPNGYAFFHANNVRLRNGLLVAKGISIYRVSDDMEFLQRINAAQAVLNASNWDLESVAVESPNLPDPVFKESLLFPTDLTVQTIQESLDPPESLSFWALPSFIKLLRISGFSTVQHEIAFQVLLALPLFCAAMTYLAASFSIRKTNRGGNRIFIIGTFTGFIVYLISKFSDQLGMSDALPVFLSAWSPSLIGFFFSISLLLHLEDG